MQVLLIAGSAAMLALTLCFFSIGTSIIVRAKQPRAAWATFWFIMSVLTLVLYTFLWQLALGNISLGNATANTKESVNLSPLWLSAIGTTLLAVITFYVSVVKPWRERPSFTIEFDNKQPFHRLADEPPNSLWLRIKVTNTGNSVAESCVGRLVELKDSSGRSVDHDPVRLHWVDTPWVEGTELFTPIDLAEGDSGFLDVLFTKRDSPAVAFLFRGVRVETVGASFQGIPVVERHVRTDDPLSSDVRRFRLTVYGSNVKPYTKEYSINWGGTQYTDIRLE